MIPTATLFRALAESWKMKPNIPIIKMGKIRLKMSDVLFLRNSVRSFQAIVNE